ncbi:hypothetical protein [Variovorax sp.]|uniref:helix-hairpin-helix domain-containing protein n=1 Tax=Variovorax sp. TaxID=1871043 RepID=UPI0037D9FDB6
MAARKARGSFLSVEDLTWRVELDAHDLERLANADALRSPLGHRLDVIWAATGPPRPLN